MQHRSAFLPIEALMDDIDRRAQAPATETPQAFFDRHMAAMRAARAPGQGPAAWWRRPMTKHGLAAPFLLICIALPSWAYVAASLFW